MYAKVVVRPNTRIEVESVTLLWVRIEPKTAGGIVNSTLKGKTKAVLVTLVKTLVSSARRSTQEIVRPVTKTI